MITLLAVAVLLLGGLHWLFTPFVDLDKLLGGSVSDYIRVHAPAPVLLVREPERC